MMPVYFEPKIIAMKGRAPFLDGYHPTLYVRVLMARTERVSAGPDDRVARKL
jgi:hypothetical protein